MRILIGLAAVALLVGACGDSDIGVGDVVDVVEEAVDETAEPAETTDGPADTTAATTTEAPTTEAPTTTEAARLAPSFPVTASSSSEDIVLVQQALIDAGYPLAEHGTDGEFGTETVEALTLAATSAGLDASEGVTAELWVSLTSD